MACLKGCVCNAHYRSALPDCGGSLKAIAAAAAEFGVPAARIIVQAVSHAS
jgi:hypothetical protein